MESDKPTDQKVAVRKGKKPTEEELKQILEDHEEWVKAGRVGPPPHDLSGANLRMANLKEAILHRIDLHGADLRRAFLMGVKLRGANLSGATLSGVNLTNAELMDAILEGADLQDTLFRGANLHNCSLQEANLRRANLKEARNLLVYQLAGSYLTGATLPEGAAKFERVDAAVRSASHARKLFTPFILACLIVLLVAFQAKLGEGIEVNYAGVKISISAMWFALGMPIGLLALFSYFLYYMGQLWENLAALPARFPDGAPIYRYPDPWFLINFTRKHLRLLKESWGAHRATTAMFFIWWLGPLTLAAATVGFFCKLKNPEVLAGNFVVFLLSCGAAYLNHFEARQTLQTLGRDRVSLEGKSLLWAAFSLSAGAMVWGVVKYLGL